MFCCDCSSYRTGIIRDALGGKWAFVQVSRALARISTERTNRLSLLSDRHLPRPRFWLSEIVRLRQGFAGTAVHVGIAKPCRTYLLEGFVPES